MSSSINDGRNAREVWLLRRINNQVLAELEEIGPISDPYLSIIISVEDFSTGLELDWASPLIEELVAAIVLGKLEVRAVLVGKRILTWRLLLPSSRETILEKVLNKYPGMRGFSIKDILFENLAAQYNS
ncbi:hypothetical protein V5R04_10720 [Jonesiaceae bacterium BS-20]|uniref:Uncharacterized protein n=1 Tax=Jonesiaceae bacterium BS-20 TaxID=3120821 RepID=A0AAU7DSM7_9MICO